MGSNSGWDDYDYHVNTGELNDDMFQDGPNYSGCFFVIFLFVIIGFAMCS